MSLWVERLPEVSEHGLWVITASGAQALATAEVKEWSASAARLFTARAEIASLSVVRVDRQDEATAALRVSGLSLVQAAAAALPLCFINGRVADLIGLNPDAHRRPCSLVTFREWIETATLKGLEHHWLTTVLSCPEAGLGTLPHHCVPALAPADQPVLRSSMQLHDNRPASRAIALGIDASWLMGPESGTQVFVVAMISELARRAEIASIVLLSDSGGVPKALSQVPKVQGRAWSAPAGSNERLDILHRPYQPDAAVDYRRYHGVARCVAVTVLDLIAYDNPAYHESRDAWRRYQEDFTEKVTLADRVFAISRFVGSRLERQFAHRLAGPVRAIHLGTDHLQGGFPADAVSDLRAEVASLASQPFLLVLGNDFAHKNRDFAVRVFNDMCARGYAGQLVLAGFHLDLGSSFSSELAGAQPYASRIVRIGAVSNPEKAALLGRAQAVLYPTSSEGFGLVPFEAAALGTPSAFVSFGSLREVMPGVRACSAWMVRAFADHVFDLLEHPQDQVAEIRAAGAGLTWATHVDTLISNYLEMLADDMPWQAVRPALPTAGARARRDTRAFAARVVRKLQRLGVWR
ncbi:MAG: glycosyltransferase [Acidobacteriota bacterium]|nr:glycosyltransferase [Acidobacteriota bacterium]